MNKRLVLVAVGALAAAALFGIRIAARAQGSTATAFLGGLDSEKTAVPTVSVFNTSAVALTLDLVLRGPDGTALVTHPAAFAVGPRATSVLNLSTELAKAGPNSKPYRGVFSAEVSGDATTFSDQTSIAYATQYFGSLKSPKAAFVVRPLFSVSP